MKELIEALEPDVHQFWPMKISMPRGKVFPEPYFGLRIGQFLNSFRPDESAEGSVRQRGSGYYSYDTKRDTAGLAFDSALIAGKHLWREQYLVKPNILMSDALQQRAAEAGLQLPKHFQAQVVSRWRRLFRDIPLSQRLFTEISQTSLITTFPAGTWTGLQSGCASDLVDWVSTA